MASLVDFYKQKLAPVGQRLSSFIDRDRSMEGTQLMRGGLGNNAKSFGKQFVQAAAQTAPTVAQDFGNVFRNTFKNVPLLSTAGNIVGDTAQRIGSGTVDVAQGAYRTLQRPDLLGKLKGATQTVRGVGKGLVSAMPSTPFIDIAANIGKEDALSRRLATGYSRGISQIPELAPNTVAKNISIGDKENPLISFDPAMTAANMVGFVKNPINAKLFKATTTLIPSADKSLKLWLTTTAARGSLENILLGLPDMPDQMTTGQKAQWMATNAGIGAVQEIVGQGIIKGLGKVGSAISESKAGKLAIEQAAKQFDNLLEFKRKWDIPYKKMGTGRLSGTEISAPMWKWKLGLVDDGAMRTFDSTIDTPKLSVEPAGKLQELETASKELGQAMNDTSKVDSVYQKYIGGKATNFTSKLDAIRNKMVTTNNDLYSARYAASKPLSVEPTGGNEAISLQKSIAEGEKTIAQLKKTLETGKTGAFTDKTPKTYLKQRLASEEAQLKLLKRDLDRLSPSVEPVGGKELTLYHGSDNVFDEMQVGRPTKRRMMLNEYDTTAHGMFFTPDKKVAGEFGKNVGEYRVNVKNPLVFSDKKNDALFNEFDRLIANDKNIDIKPGEPGFQEFMYFDGELGKKFTAFVKQKGFDGAKIRETSEFTGDNFDTIVAFDNAQVKNAKSLSPSPLGGKVEPKIVTPIRKPLKEVYKEQLTKGADTLQPSTPLENIQPVPKALDNLGISTTPQPVSQTIQTVRKITQLDQPSESIIQEARKQIGSTPDPKDKSIKEVLDDTYSSWVDRYNPLTKASNVAKKTLKGQGAELRPEYDPTYLVRRLTGAGGIADQRFRTELNPILKEMESLNIPKADMDVYLANKRMAGFGKAGRDIYGTDPVKAGQVVSALEAKYPQINGVAQKMYSYQDKGLNEIAQAGFLSPESITALKSQNPDYAPLYRVMDEMDNYLGLPTRKTMQGTSPISKIKGSTRQIESPVESIIGNTFRQRAAIEKNRVAQSVIDLQKISPDLGFTKVSKSAPDTITVWKNGQKEYWRVGQDIADTAKGVNEESMNLLLKILQAPASLLRQGATGRNPEFLLPNILRDNLDAGVTSKYGYIPFVDYFSGLISMAKNDDVYQKWANSGAKIDLGEISGKKSIQKLFDSKVEKKKLSTWLTQGLDVLGTLSEQPTRVGLFKKAYQKTGNEMLAMMESRDATVDFARMGSKMKVANSIIPFLNVGVQGFDKLIRAVKDSPGRVAFNVGIYGVLPALMTTLYNLNNDPESYNEIPQYEKDSNFVLVTGRNDDGTVDYLTFPKGNVIPSIANPIESFLAFTKNEDPEAFKRMLVSTLTGTLPVIGDGSTAGEVATKTIGGLIPQGIKPIAENLLNKSFYKYDPSKEQSKDIVPSYLQNKPDYQQTYEFTPQMYQKLGAVFDASPLKVKNLMEGYLAGFTKIPSQIYEMAYKLSRGEEISPNDKTLMRRFLKQTYPSSGKAPQVKPESPGLMERVTGKVGAAETSVKKVIPEWQIDNAKTELKSSDKTSKKISDNLYLVKQTNGDVSRLNLSNVTKMPSTTNYEQVKKETEKWKLADDILKLDPTDQVEAFKQLGISKDDAEYYTVAKDTVEAKAAYIKDQVQGVKNYDEFLNKVAPLTREVNGEKILSDGVVDWMYQNDIITSAQRKQLKSLEYDNVRKVTKVSSKKSSSTIKKVTARKLGKFNLAGRVKKVKRIRTKQYKLVVKTK